MKKFLESIFNFQTLGLVMLFGCISISLAACGASQESPVTPAPDRLTLLYFFTDD